MNNLRQFMGLVTRRGVPWILGLAILGPQGVVTAARLDIYPPKVVLSSPNETLSVLVIQTTEAGRQRDVTEHVEYRLGAEGVARVTENRIAAVGDGSVTLTATHEGQSTTMEIVVQHADQIPPVGFRRDVIPIFTKSGCNSGTCHGSSRGQDGFRLSLFGFDPRGDYLRITRELATRRIRLAVPESSLLLEKAIGSVPHTGGKRMEVESDAYRILRDWVRQGAVWDEDAPRVTDLALFPPELVLGLGDPARLIAIATYSDGTQRDVTPWSVFQSTDDSVSSVDTDGRVVVTNRGES
ncbi:MAG TPA: cell surface protein, partial [Pirellulaceae bacterium]